MAQLAHEEGMQLDVATGGELHVALHAGVPADRLVMHGNNKSEAELRMALEAGVGRIVVDSFDELDRIEALVIGWSWPTPPCSSGSIPVSKLTPTNTSRPGSPTRSSDSASPGAVAEAAIDRAAGLAAMDLAGLHAHIGSQVFVVDSFVKAIGALAPLVHRADAREFSIGGGLGVAYVEGESAPDDH